MIALFKFPLAVTEHLSSAGLVPGEALFVMRSDIGVDGIRKDVFIAMDGKKLYITEGSLTVSASENTTDFGNRARNECFSAERTVSFELASLSNPQSEQLISTGNVTAEVGGAPVRLFCFTNTFRHDASVFVRALTEIKETGKLDEKNFKKDSYDEYYCPKCGRRYPSTGAKICPNCMDKVRLIKKLAKIFIRYKGYIILIITALAMMSALAAVTPYISNKIFYNDVLIEGGQYFGMIWQIVLVMIGIKLGMLVIQLINGAISAKVAADVTYDLKREIFASISRLSLSFFTNRQTGGLMTQINSDSLTIYWFFCDGFPFFVLNMVQLVVIFAIMLTMNPLLALYTFVTAPIFFITFKVIFLAFDRLHAKNYSRRRSLNSLISDVLNGMRVVKAFSREEDERNRFDKRSRASAETAVEIDTKAAKAFPFIFYLLKIGSYIVWALGGLEVMSHNLGGAGMDYGTLMTFIAYFSMIFGPIEFLADVSNWWSECLNALQRLFQITDAVPEVRDSENPVDMSNLKGDVEFRDVTFSYEENRRVIDGVSFKVKAGDTLGIVGHTGAGKSTIVNLLARLYDVESGGIFIDGVNVKDISMTSLRKNLAIVSQETYLFRGTLLDNIRYANPEASFEEVVAASKMAGAHDFIMKYPDGYETQIGFGHKDLSGGEKQRVSIARAILKNPRILILDEATAAMDTQTERRISEALSRLTVGRTTIIIAHRLSTLRDADNLIVIENGKMPESGTVKELLALGGVYYKLYKMQTDALRVIGISDEADEPPHGPPGPPPKP